MGPLVKRCVMMWCMLLYIFFVCVVDSIASESVRVVDGRVTLVVDNAPLKNVLQELEKESGVSIRYYGDSDVTISLNITNCPLDDGLRLISGKFNRSTVYESTGEGEEMRIASLYIYSTNGAKKVDYSWQEKPDEEVHMSLAKNVPRVTHNPEGVAVYALKPDDRDPLLNMGAHDPLVQVGNDGFSFLNHEKQERRRLVVN